MADLLPSVSRRVTDAIERDHAGAGAGALAAATSSTTRLSRLGSLSADHPLEPSLTRLTEATDYLTPTLRFIVPYQTVCNYIVLSQRNISSTVSEGNASGTWMRFQLFLPFAEIFGAAEPARNLHYNPYPAGAAPSQKKECEAGNAGVQAGPADRRGARQAAGPHRRHDTGELQMSLFRRGPAKPINPERRGWRGGMHPFWVGIIAGASVLFVFYLAYSGWNPMEPFGSTGRVLKIQVSSGAGTPDQALHSPLRRCRRRVGHRGRARAGRHRGGLHAARQGRPRRPHGRTGKDPPPHLPGGELLHRPPARLAVRSR